MQTLYFAWSFLLSSQPSQIGFLAYLHTWCGLSVNLGCRSETCCMRLAENTGRKNSLSAHHRTNLSSYIFATKTCNDNRIKTSNISSRCPHNMVNFGPRASEIGPVVCGTPANFNRFNVVAALLHGTPAVGLSQTLKC